MAGWVRQLCRTAPTRSHVGCKICIDADDRPCRPQDEHEQVREVLDLPREANAALARVRRQTAGEGVRLRDHPQPVTPRARIFALGRAVLQHGLADTGLALVEAAARIPVDPSAAGPRAFVDLLQDQIGEAVLAQAEIDATTPAISWPELLKAYDGFGVRFPASRRLAYREAADVLRQMIADESAHHTKPEQMSPEQAAEYIYRLRTLELAMPYWSANGPYPVASSRQEGRRRPDAVHHLIDLGHAAIPRLIEALDDRSFTRVASFKGYELPQAMRVGDFARNILSRVGTQLVAAA